MEIGFIGLGKMGFPMARRLVEAGHQLVVYDSRREAMDKLVALGAQAATSAKDVADRTETVLASLPSLQISLDVATGKDGVIEGKRVKRLVDLSTTGSQMAIRIHGLLAKKDIGDVRQQVALTFGFVGENAGLAAAIQGATKEEMEASAKGLESFKKTPKAPNLDPGGGGGGPPPTSKDPVKNYVTTTYKPPTLAA